MKKTTIPFYLQYWFIAILFIMYPFTYFISAIVASIFLARRSEKFPTLHGEKLSEWLSVQDAKSEAENIINSANSNAEQIKAEAEKSAKDSIARATTITSGLESKKKNLEREIDRLQTEKKENEEHLKEQVDAVLFSQTTVDFTDSITANEIKSMLSVIQLREKELIKSGEAIKKLNSGIPKSNFNKQSKQLLRAFNAEADYYNSNITIKNVDTYRNRLAKAFETLNKLFEVDGVQISHELLNWKLKQLDVIYKYQKQLEIEKELLKAQKEEIREQQKVEKEIQDQKRKLEKEEQQFNNEMSKLLQYLNKANNEVEQGIYADKIKELEEKIKLLEKDKQNILERESNTRAGYVYIISNIGSFGENVYKIGMTRRLEPMDRISELSSASVPFPFDVHALIFSEDAPKLETTLHSYFKKQEVNKVNPRKEFFRVNLNEIKELVHKEFNNTVHFTDLAAAEQYFETLKLEKETN
ncbi:MULTISPECIES: DUF4041 domain-containing protein [unclassified Streptococcus]|uniref:DUF4041 domain-containing protein n=1 Tax=unclassified Streptococcus TaxID=2608887 RepID=UPI00211AE2A1|nr:MULTISPECIES: DUF4041 domain-containing protein [unclassified Streptococcus]MCQ9212250.1 DUF4041 domain-containing protein [Streptococcus sp. B01]MCQ9213581.1 DUF4041 domain-containing protein [Streptococcus sp. O1]